MSAEPANVLRLVAHDDGSTDFATTELTLTVHDFAPPAAPFEVSETMEASGVVSGARRPDGMVDDILPLPHGGCACSRA